MTNTAVAWSSKPRAEPTLTQMLLLRFIAEGYTTNEAADEIGMSHFTARTHVQSAMRILGAKSRTHAVAMCIREGWIT